MKSISDIFNNKKKVLAVVAHPDDFEGYFGGSILSLLNTKVIEAKSIFILLATNGGNGGQKKHTNSKQLETTRIQEQKNSLKFLGIPESNLFTLGLEDGFLFRKQDFLLERIVYYFRSLNPDLILSHNGFEKFYERNGLSKIIHKDHRILGELVLDAMYPFSRDKLFFSSHFESINDYSTPKELLICETGEYNLEVDYSNFVEQKVNLMNNFQSQFETKKIIKEVLDRMDGLADGRFLEKFKYLKIH